MQIADWRARSGLSQTDAVLVLGISKEHLSRLENKKYAPSFSTMLMVEMLSKLSKTELSDFRDQAVRLRDTLDRCTLTWALTETLRRKLEAKNVNTAKMFDKMLKVVERYQ